MKKILLIILLICTLQISSAATYHYNTDGTGTFSSIKETIYYYPDGHNVYVYWTFYIPEQCSGWGGPCIYPRFRWYVPGSGWYWLYDGLTDGGCGLRYIEKSRHGTQPNCGQGLYYHCNNYPDYYLTLTISDVPLSQYHVHGTASCVSLIELYKKNNDGSYQLLNDCTSEDYSFSIRDQQDYKLVFDGGHEYEFYCNGSDIEYDYDACTYIYGYTCNINWVKLWRNDAGSWTYVDMESQPNHGLNTYVLQIESGYDYKVNFSDGHEHEFTCSGSDIRYDWDRCVWAYPPSLWQPPEIIPWYLGYDNNIVFMRDSHGNFIENAQIAVYNKNTGNYTQKWTNTPDPYILLAANNDSNDDVVVMCRTFDGIFTLETVDPAFGTDENVTWTNWTIPIMYNLEIHPIDQSNMPLHDVFVSMYEYTPFNPRAYFGYDTYWGHIPITNCTGFSRCDLMAEKEGYQDYSVTGLNWTAKSALIKDYKHNIVMSKES